MERHRRDRRERERGEEIVFVQFSQKTMPYGHTKSRYKQKIPTKNKGENNYHKKL